LWATRWTLPSELWAGPGGAVVNLHSFPGPPILSAKGLILGEDSFRPRPLPLPHAPSPGPGGSGERWATWWSLPPPKRRPPGRLSPQFGQRSPSPFAFALSSAGSVRRCASFSAPSLLLFMPNTGGGRPPQPNGRLRVVCLPAFVHSRTRVLSKTALETFTP